MESLSTSVCRSCRLRVKSIPQSRAFSTSTSRQIVPPESPAFIDVPSSYQPDLPLPRRRKGVLPVPRELFPAKRPDKPSPEYLANVTKSPLPHNVKSEDKLTELGKFRLRMAETRKRHLREGLTELHKRKQDTISNMEYRSTNRQAERTRLMTQPEREDSRLTAVSTPAAMRSVKSSTPISDDLAAVKAIYEQKKANYERVSKAKQDQRLDALHTLYMNARTFITTEEQLNEAIDAQFDPNVFTNNVGPGKSIWNKGRPDTIKDMIANTRGGASSTSKALQQMSQWGSQAAETTYLRDQDRMKKIAEKLSGGKI